MIAFLGLLVTMCVYARDNYAQKALYDFKVLSPPCAKTRMLSFNG